MLKSCVTLIGMPGAGKSTTGVILAKLLSLGFMDTDLLIQINRKSSLQDIVDKKGHLYLRKVEEKEILKINLEKCVIATGGSAVYSPKSMEHLSSISTVVFLKVSLEVLKNRISNFKKRGLAKAKEQSFEDLFLERQPLYEKYADMEIDCNSISQERAAEMIVERLKISYILEKQGVK